jgi:hypothetical protein
MQDLSDSSLHQQQQRIRQTTVTSRIINRYNVKLFIRILVGLALAHVIGQRFRPSDAAPSSTKSNWKHRPQKLQASTTADGMLIDKYVLDDVYYR